MRIVSVRGKRRAVCEAMEGFVYCGRKFGEFSGSPLGNEARVGRDGDLKTVLAKYRRWLWKKLQDEASPQFQELANIEEDAVLGCWCVNKEIAGTGEEQCHCDVIAKAWNWLADQYR